MYLHNDNINSFGYIITALIEICNHTLDQANQCAITTHFNDKCDILRNDDLSTLNKIKKKLEKRGLTISIALV